MPDVPTANSPTDLLEDTLRDDEPVLPRKPMSDSAELDITPMIDVVFLLLIFFLVSSTPDQNTAVELPPAQFGKGVSQQTSVIITVSKREGNRPAAVYLADGAVGEPLPDDPKQKEAAVIEAVEKGFLNEQKTSVLIKGDRTVKEKEIQEVAKAVGKADVKDAKLHVGVFEEE